MKLSKSITVQELAKFLKAKFAGNPKQKITGFNEIHCVNAGDVTFVDVEKYFSKALNSKATIIILNKKVDCPAGKSLIFSDDPFHDYNKCTEHFQPRIKLNALPSKIKEGKNVRIGKNVVFGNNVSIGNDTEVFHNCVIGNNVSIGKNSIIHPNVTIYDNSVIGNNVTINSGTVIGSEAFYFKRREKSHEKLLSKGRTVIKDNVDIGANCTIDRGVSGDTIIGEWTKLDNLVQVGHDTVIGKRCIIASQTGIAGVVTIEDDVILWGQVGISKDLKIGKGTVVLSKSGVMSSLEEGKTFLGIPVEEARTKLRQIASMKKLPELVAEWEKRNKNSKQSL